MSTISHPGRGALLRRRSALGAGALALVLVGGTGGWTLARHSASDPAGAPRTQLVPVQQGTLTQTVGASGTLEPANQANVQFQTAGTVTKVLVSVGEKVTKGEELATLDATNLRSAVTLAQAGVDAAEAGVNAASTTAASATANAQLAQARQQLQTAQSNLAAATLTAPIAGVVSGVGLTAGSTVAAAGGSGVSGGSGGTGGSSGSGGSGSGGSGGGQGGSSGSGSSGGAGSSSGSAANAIGIVDTSSWVVDAGVGSSDLAALKPSLQAAMTPQGTGNNQPFFGTVRSVGVVASSAGSGSAQFPVVIDVTGHPAGLHAGVPVTTAITTKVVQNALTVPTLAVTSQNGQTMVQLNKDGQITAAPVTIGGVFGNQTQILKGLSAGDQVVVTYPTYASNGGAGGGTGGGSRGGFGFGQGGQDGQGGQGGQGRQGGQG